tara:strand:+ start:502 stop:771 length:270 start_codon:yes stop_codon:yes gene_type:complete
MIQKADIVTMRGLKSDKLGLVEKLFEHEGEEYAIILWIKPVPNVKTYCSTSRLKTLRTAAEAAQRGRKKVIPGLEEGSETHVVKIVNES